MTALRVVSPGSFTTLQDAGRPQWQHMGVPVCGPMDPFAFWLANALVGNPLHEGALELTLTGGCYVVEDGSCRVALTGDFACTVNGAPVPAWQAHDLASGDMLKIGTAQHGLRGYLAVAGGFHVRAQLGSVATLVRAGLGGFDGRSLAKADRLPLRLSAAPDTPRLRLPAHADPADFRWYWSGPIRVVPGPQTVAAEAFTRFCQTTYRISSQADRMGYRLQGPPVVHGTASDIISEAIAPGSIQVPGDGQPIIALCDRQTTGGYLKIATVIRADLPRLGQMRPGVSLSFLPCAVETAEAQWCRSMTALRDTIAQLHCTTFATNP